MDLESAKKFFSSRLFYRVMYFLFAGLAVKCGDLDVGAIIPLSKHVVFHVALFGLSLN